MQIKLKSYPYYRIRMCEIFFYCYMAEIHAIMPILSAVEYIII
jgi:hypothetical protein